MSYQPDYPDDLSLFLKRIERNQAIIDELEKEVRAFLLEVDIVEHSIINMRKG